MLIKYLIFVLATYGIAIVISLCIALIIKGIALAVQGRGRTPTDTHNDKQ